MITCKIKDGKSKAVDVTIKESGAITRKIISIDDFLMILKDSVESESVYRPIGVLPEGYVDGAVHMLEEASFQCVIRVPGGKRMLSYFGDKMLVPFPTTVFYFEVKNAKVVKSSCFSALDDKVNEESKLYRYPYGNVYDDGRICWGSNVLPQINSMGELHEILMLFFGSETNDDLYSSSAGGNIKAVEYTRTQRYLLTEMQKKETFPLELLIPSGIKVAQLMS